MSLRPEGASVGSNWAFSTTMPAPVGNIIPQQYALSPTTPVEVARATGSTDNVVGAQFRSHIFVPGTAFQPTGGEQLQTTLTWTWAVTP